MSSEKKIKINIYNEAESKSDDLINKISMRGKMGIKDVLSTVEEILNRVKDNGNEALYEYTKKFDGVEILPQELKVSSEEIQNALDSLDKGLLDTMKRACDNIMEFHLAQKQNDLCLDRGEGSYIKLLNRPLETVGIYVPGGTAPLPSSVIMNGAPAKAAGVGKIIMCTPPRKDKTIAPSILAAASLIGIDEIYKAGGAQAIAAMAYGSSVIPGVDKICGPGNIYVNTAKRLVFGIVDIDMFAGPSEILILADESAVPANLAMDMIAQSEHDVLASSILITDSERIAGETKNLVESFAEKMPRKDILRASLSNYSAVIIVENMDEGVKLANKLAPEHLEICTKNPALLLPDIKNAGAVFLGNYTPESLGDYYAGPNHVLPTSGTARFFSPLNTADFIKKTSVIEYSEKSLKDSYRDVARFARAEGLEGHARAAEIRFET